MGIRFRHSIKIAPGLKLNINKNSVGLSAGVKGAHVSVNSKGRKTTSIGIPGTGLSYTKVTNKKKVNTNGNEDTQFETKPKSPIPLYIVGGLLVLLGLACVSSNVISGIIALALGTYVITVARKKSKAAQTVQEEIIQEDQQ